MSEPTVIPSLPDLCWPVDWACDQDFYTEHSATPEGLAILQRAEALAAQTLRLLTGYKVGGCPILVRPCSKTCSGSYWQVAPVMPGNFAGYSGSFFSPFVGLGGKWMNACGCQDSDSCSCTTIQEVILPGSVGAVTSVMIDGEVVDPSTYAVYNGNRLVRMDGQAWPICQDMNLDVDQEGTFAVVYLDSAPVDGLGSYAAGRLAREYAAACTGGNCQLPPGVVSVVRQGITMDIATGSFPGGMTGIREVDVYIQFWNPYRSIGGAQVFSIDVPQARQLTWRA